MWGQRSSRVIIDLLVKVFWSLSPILWCILHGTWTQWYLGRVTHATSTEVGSKVPTCHLNRYGFESNITMIAKVCDRESRRDSWFENRLACISTHWIGIKSKSFRVSEIELELKWFWDTELNWNKIKLKCTYLISMHWNRNWKWHLAIFAFWCIKLEVNWNQKTYIKITL